MWSAISGTQNRGPWPVAALTTRSPDLHERFHGLEDLLATGGDLVDVLQIVRLLLRRDEHFEQVRPAMEQRLGTPRMKWSVEALPDNHEKTHRSAV